MFYEWMTGFDHFDCESKTEDWIGLCGQTLTYVLRDSHVMSECSDCRYMLCVWIVYLSTCLMSLNRLDAAHPVSADKQEEVEGLQDPCVHWRQDQQDWPWPQSVSTYHSNTIISNKEVKRKWPCALRLRLSRYYVFTFNKIFLSSTIIWYRYQHQLCLECEPQSTINLGLSVGAE